ncbi:hypothetical protein COU15_00005 [Candidatus Kaiserbacteria bacterium CG10_big_fil_rev_8_21_14_0_10_45_20]|uniref:Uncharacterized protein n=1 Tax=Candidatus Kaiserbacteria bacterium CG10_big_fil_rev_8_21_14_0_10_45_20 TaxID=1974607 RepID=A0A2H0UIE6_9BACT|nr:MAG: hypothetical protein COU15_00005 [Candidatus Kaiserbacteria bacterium CG10_big_fil_rev_8_21_14_0_10_45_20]
MESLENQSFDSVMQEQFEESGIERGSIVAFEIGAMDGALFKVIGIEGVCLRLRCIERKHKTDSAPQVIKGYTLPKLVPFRTLKLVEASNSKSPRS